MKLINDLRQTNSRLQKEQVLKYSNITEQRVLHYAYNPHLRFGIANVTANSKLGEPNDELFNLLDLLANKTLIGNAARNAVYEHAEKYGDLIYLICRKDLDCGVSAKTINKVISNLIPVFNVQLAKEVPIAELKYPLMAEVKYDGVRAIARSRHGKCELFTRNGKLINCPGITDVIAKSKYSDNLVLDGELILAKGKMLDRTSISGKVNSALHGGELCVDGITFKVFDCMLAHEFDGGECYDSYAVRANTLIRIISDLKCEYISKSTSEYIYSAEDANKYYTDLLSQGYEGMILKGYRHKYTFKRSKDWVKVKAIKSIDLVCSTTMPGKPGTKYEEAIGALECYGTVEGKQVKVSVGSGLTDKDRHKGTHFYEGKTIEIKYNDIIRNAEDNGWTLFLPRFVSVRFDK